MSDAFAIAASGLRAQDFHIDQLAHDLANLNTNNYKASAVHFAETLQASGNASAARSDGVVIAHTGKNFSQGPLKPTGNRNDVAIDGTGFFQVENADGEPFYSRNSTLTVDEDHYLALENGMRLTDNIAIPEDFTGLTINKQGEVHVTLPDTTEPQLVGTIRLARFTNPEGLEAAGAGIYRATRTSGESIQDFPGSNGIGSLLQHTVEGSNTDMVSTLMQLTMAQRVYQLNAKAMEVADELEKITNALRD